LTKPSLKVQPANLVSLREYFEREMKHERELRELQHDNDEMALKLQAAEYERRLEGLNGEAGRIRDVLDKSVSQEKFEGFQSRALEKIEAVSDEMERRFKENATLLAAATIAQANKDIGQATVTGTAKGRDIGRNELIASVVKAVAFAVSVLGGIALVLKLLGL
jgi:hypothetical protein